jgi:hypothetical protein
LTIIKHKWKKTYQFKIKNLDFGNIINNP